MKLSLFKIGLILIIGGSLWISFVFTESDKVQDTFLITESNSVNLGLKLMGNEIGYYKIFMPEFGGDELFIQIQDDEYNIIQEEVIQTKMSVGYFDFSEDGIYTIKVTNISKNQIKTEIEFGNTNSQKMIPGGILLFIGAITMIVIAYLKLKNYNIAQPDENIS